MNKNLEYYMKLPYKIKVEKIPEHVGGGYFACVPLLGTWAVCADGETEEEAREKLKEIMRDRLIEYINEELDIPEPE